MQNPKHIHLIGICGTAMASLAGMLQQQGHRITGSDAAAYPPMSDQLAALGIPIHQPYSEANLTPRPDLVIVGNAISRGNLELEHVLDHRIPFRSMAAILHDQFLADRQPLVVAGTHGKTTTTSMLAWIYEVASRTHPAFAPSFLIGGVAENFGTSFKVRPVLHDQPAPPFLLEGDEYDTAFFDKGPKFLHYFPQALILTHVEFDHADIYPDLAAVKTAFKRLVNLVPRSGRIVAFDGSENVTECITKAFCPVERYGFSPESHWQLSNLRHEGTLTHWTLRRNHSPSAPQATPQATPQPVAPKPSPGDSPSANEVLAELTQASPQAAPHPAPPNPSRTDSSSASEVFAELTLPMPGAHNALNATAAAALAAGQGIPASAIVQALATFQSVKRRLEVRAVIHNITIIDDFAHHPTAIRETLRALRESYPAQRLIAVLEPRSNTLRRNVFESELIDALALADQVVLANVFQSENIPTPERLHPEHIIAALTRRGTPASLHPDADAIVASLAPQLRPGDIVAILSNGAFGNIYQKLPTALTLQPL
ncbi:MAG: Mur ligase domain-containing protein [Acidobacteriota bacterium]|nr:Mur ligase domain-containing protein [Acidobacteriota bacterium]